MNVSRKRSPPRDGKRRFRRHSPDAFTPEFFRDEDKLRQWSAFVRDFSVPIPPLGTVISELAAFIDPVTVEARALLQKEGQGLGLLPQRRSNHANESESRHSWQ